MTYTLLLTGAGVRRDADGATIPADPGNLDWQAYQVWLDAGNQASPATDAAEVEMRQLAMAALDASDVTILRCIEAGTAVPPAWGAYRKALRAVLAGAAKALPERPVWPANV